MTTTCFLCSGTPCRAFGSAKATRTVVDRAADSATPSAASRARRCRRRKVRDLVAGDAGDEVAETRERVAVSASVGRQDSVQVAAGDRCFYDGEHRARSCRYRLHLRPLSPAGSALRIVQQSEERFSCSSRPTRLRVPIVTTTPGDCTPSARRSEGGGRTPRSRHRHPKPRLASAARILRCASATSTGCSSRSTWRATTASSSPSDRPSSTRTSRSRRTTSSRSVWRSRRPNLSACPSCRCSPTD